MSDLVLQKITDMKILLFAIINLSTILFSIGSYSQNIDSDCNCDIEITSKTDELPGDGNSYDLTRNKTICFIGKFDYKIDWAKLGDNVTLCVGEEVKFKSKGLNFEGSKTIYNYGEFEYDQSLKLDENSEVVNYGKMESKFGFEGGSLNNLSGAELSIEAYSDFSSGSVFNDNSSAFKLKQKENTSLGTSMVFESQGESKFEGDIDNNGRLTLSGKSEFKKKLINNGFSTLSGELKFEEGYISNSPQANTEANGFLEIDGDVNLWEGHLEASAGLEFGNKTIVNERASIHFLGSAKFDELTLRGELYTELNCNTLEIKNAKGWGGKISANSASTISVKDLNKLPSKWILQGNVTSEKCNTNGEIVVWLGSKSSDVKDKDNWSGKIKNKSVLIPKTNFNPIFNKNVSLFNVIIKEGAVLTNLAEIEIKGNLFSKGDLNSINGNFSFKGAEIQYFSTDSTTSVYNLTIDNGHSLNLVSGNVDIFNSLNLTTGDLITNYDHSIPGNNLVTFKSNATNTAIISKIENGNTIIGEVMIERYITMQNRAFRFITTSVNTTTSINENWQEGVNNTVNDYTENKDPNPGYGTHITGSTTGANGLDATPTGNPSLFSWDSQNGSWSTISNTNTNTLEAGKAYGILIRGDRGTNMYLINLAKGDDTRLRSLGTILTGNINIDDDLNPNSDGFALIGNPYQAEVDMKATLKNSSTHLCKRFYYAYKPRIGDRGGYVTVDLDSEPVEHIPEVPLNNNMGPQKFRFLQVNQAVFVQTDSDLQTGEVPSLTFKEEYKTDQTSTNEVLRINSNSKIDLNIFSISNEKLMDGVRFKFDTAYDEEAGPDDALKFWNDDETIGIQSDGKFLAIEKRPFPKDEDVFSFWIGNYRDADYTMNVEVEGMPDYDVFLRDTYTEVDHQLNEGENDIAFSIDSSIPASVNSDRFKIRFKQVTLGTSQNEMTASSQLYPNPSNSGFAYLKHNPDFDNELTVSVFNMVGQNIEISKDRVSSGELKLNTSSLNAGIYLVKLTYRAQTTTHKLIVE